MSIALIAGDGDLPVEIARRLSLQGESLRIYALRESPDALKPYSDMVVNLLTTELEFAVRDMKMNGVKKIIMAGVVPKTLIYRPGVLDKMAQSLVAGLDERDDHSVLGAVVSFLTGLGFEVLSYRSLLLDLMAKEGHFAGRQPTPEEQKDVEYGVRMAQKLVSLSFGQTVVVHQKSVVAVEAMEGPDATLLRAGSLCKKGVVVKLMRSDQDERYDIPTVGPQTLRLMGKTGLSCLALHAGWTLIINPEEFYRVAAEENISVVGVDSCRSL